MAEQQKCQWLLDDATDSCLWETSCGEAFQFTEGGPEDNKFKYCYKCGKEIEAVRKADWPEESDDVVSECCDVSVTWTYDGAICDRCGKWAVTKKGAVTHDT